LNRGDVDDDPGSLFDHRGQERPIQTDGCQEILGNRLIPLAVAKHGVSAGRGCGASDDVNDDIDTTETLPHRTADNRTPFGSRYIRCDEEIRLGK
jgi:hypothetical protein